MRNDKLIRRVISVGLVLAALGVGLSEFQRRRAAVYEEMLLRESASNMGLALSMYVSDNDQRFPLRGWESALAPYAKRDVSWGWAQLNARYAMNRFLLGESVTRLRDPSKTVAFFLSEGSGSNAIGTKQDAVERFGWCTVVTAEGKSLILKKSSLEQLTWSSSGDQL